MTGQPLLSGKERFLIPDGLLRDPTAAGRAEVRIGAERSQITKAPRHKIIVDASISRRVPALIQCRVGKPPAPDPKPQSGVPGRRTGDLCRINCGSMLALPTTTLLPLPRPPLLSLAGCRPVAPEASCGSVCGIFPKTATQRIYECNTSQPRWRRRQLRGAGHD
jgi:hypothetical protein